MFTFIALKFEGDMLFYGYTAYSMFLSKKKWFQLTTSLRQNTSRLFALFFIPEIFIRVAANHLNQNFYERNHTIFETILRKEDLGKINFRRFY